MALTPYYADKWTTIYHGDAASLQFDGIDVIITDPPYGMGTYEWDRDQYHVLVRYGGRVPLAVFGYPERLIEFCVGHGSVPDEWITWWPTNARIKAFGVHGLLNEVECVAVFGASHLGEIRQRRGPDEIYRVGYQSSGRLDSNGEPDRTRLGDCWTDASPGIGFNSHKRLHPNEKPVSLMRRLVVGMSVPDDVILDPFMGSGTTLLAAKEMGRKAIGIEIEERYCEIAARRLSQEVLDFGGAA